jgi:hypothetical protein
LGYVVAFSTALLPASVQKAYAGRTPNTIFEIEACLRNQKEMMPMPPKLAAP